MALQTKSISAVSSNGNHKFTLKIVENEIVQDSNTSKATVTFTLSPATSTAYGWNYTSKEPVTYTVKVGGTTYTGAIMSYTKNSTVTILSKNVTPYHLIDGTRTMAFSFEVKSLSGSLLPGTASKSGTITLTRINRASTFTANGTWYIGQTPKKYITVTAYDSHFSHRVSYSMGSASGYFTGTSKDYIEGGGEYFFAIPLELANQIPNALSGTVKVTLETFYYDEDADSYTTIGTTSKNVTVYINKTEFAPELNPTVVDINPETIALTGYDFILIKGHSTVKATANALAVGGATLKAVSISDGSSNKVQKYEVMGTLEFENAESKTYTFKATDSRGLVTTKTITETMLDYVKPTASIELTRPNGEGLMTVKVGGRYWNDGFGAQDNTITLQFRCKPLTDETDEDGNPVYGDWTDWVSIPIEEIDFSEEVLNEVMDSETGKVIYYYTNEYTYDAEVEYTVPDYTRQWTFEARIIDKLNTYKSNQASVKAIPIFDWSDEDFNFNTSVGMYGKTVLRANQAQGHTVLSSNGGDVFIRPNGTDSSEYQSRFYADGSVVLGGKTYGANTLLWSGTSYMGVVSGSAQEQTLNASVANQANGIVLVFSAYDTSNSKALNENWHSFFIPKGVINNHSGYGHNFTLQKGGKFFQKFIYVYPTRIVGNAINNNSSYSLHGQTVNNCNFVLREVWGV